MSLRVLPITMTEALAFVREHHSHLDAGLPQFYASSVHDERGLRCVALLGRPKSRELQAQGACEVTRVASDGAAEHAASMALAALVRAGRALGWERFVSYTILGEAGTIYRAAGWWPVAITRPDREWSCETRPREETEQPGSKVRWETYDRGVCDVYDAARFALGLRRGLLSAEREAVEREAERLQAIDRRVRDAVGKVAIPPRAAPLMPLFAPAEPEAEP